MKLRKKDLAPRYLAALRAHVSGQTPPRVQLAKDLGSDALAQGIAALDLAAVHHEAMLVLTTSRDFVSSRRSIRAAGAFFAQALVPLENNRRALRQANGHLLLRNETLRLHAAALARGNRRLER